MVDSRSMAHIPPSPELRNERTKRIGFRNSSPGRVVLDRDVDSPQRRDYVTVGIGDGLNLNLASIVGERKADVIARAIDAVRPGFCDRNVLRPSNVVGGAENAVAGRHVRLLEPVQEDAAVGSILDGVPGELRRIASRHDALDHLIRYLFGDHVFLAFLRGGHRQTKDACKADQANREYGHGDHHFKQRKPTLQLAWASESLSVFAYCRCHAGPPPPLLYSRQPRIRPVAP